MSSYFDTITRSYKNAAGNIIGVTTISLQCETPAFNSIPGQFPDAAIRFHRRVTAKSSFQSVTTVMGESRVVSTIQMYGLYNSFTMNGSNNDFLSVTYTAVAPTNEVIIGFDSYPTVGETV